MITVVGIGPGDLTLLAPQAQFFIQQADILVGGARHLALFPAHRGETRRLDADLPALMDWLAARQRQAIVVLASGDPLLYGIGKRLAAHFPPDQLRIVPGISAIQYLCARIALDMNNLLLSSSHGREPDFDWLVQHHKVALVTDARIGPCHIAQALLARQAPHRLIIGENLSLPTERILHLSLLQAATRDDMKQVEMNVVVMLNER